MWGIAEHQDDEDDEDDKDDRINFLYSDFVKQMSNMFDWIIPFSLSAVALLSTLQQ